MELFLPRCLQLDCAGVVDVLLLTCHRRPRIASVAVELCVKSGSVNDSWCMCVANVGEGW